MALFKKVTSISLTDSGHFYTTAPSITFTGGFANSSDKIKFGNNSLDLGTNSYTYSVDSADTSMDGFIAFWLWVDSDALPDSAGSNLKPLWEMGVYANGANRRRFGLNSGGQLVSTTKYANKSNLITWYNTPYGTDERVQEGQWNHISLSFYGADQGWATRRADVYINGVLTYYTNSTSFAGFFHDSDILFGSQLQGDFNGTIFFDSPTGMYMDNLYLDSVGYPSAHNLYTQDSDGGAWNTSTLAKHVTFNNDSAVATATIDSDGKVNSTTITSGGFYVSAPTVVFSAAPSTLVSQGDSATQTLSSGVKVTGELIKYSDSDGILYIAHVGADDGKYHSFVTGRDIRFGNTSNSYIRNVTAVSEDNKLSENEQNTDFSSIAGDFLDFSENNPFGDPENN